MAKNGKYYIGFDLGGTKMRSVVVDSDFKIKSVCRKKTRAERGVESCLSRMESCVDESLADAGISAKDVAGMGFALPGVLDVEKGVVLMLPNMNWRDVSIRKHFQGVYDAPVVIDNDVNSGVYGEYRFGAGRKHRDIVGIFPGTGIGGGIIINGAIHRGVAGVAGEVGHMIYRPGGARCGCGGRGCYEAYAGRPVIAGQAAAAAARGMAPALMEATGTDISDIRSGALAKSIAAGDTAIEEIVREAGALIGQLACGLVATLSPSMVILGGGLVEAMEDLFVEECQKALDAHPIATLAHPVDVAAAKLGDDAVNLGAAALVADAVAG